MRVATILAALVLAGCLGDAARVPDHALPVEAGRIPAGEEGLSFLAPTVAIPSCGAPLGDLACFEPSVVEEAAGRLMVANGFGGQLARSLDGGATWVPAAAPRPLERPFAAGGDALLQRGPDASVWLSALQPREVQVARTTDGGLTWTPSGLVPFGGRVDRNWLVFGEGLLVAHVQGEEGVRAAASRDGGATWDEAVAIHPAPAIHGPGVGVGREVLVPVFDYSAGELVVFASGDGRAWERRLVSARAGDFFPVLAAENGVVHAAWKSFGGELLVASSRDAGRTWSEPAVASLPEERVAVSPWAVARDGALVVLYFTAASPDAPGTLRALRIEGEQVTRGTLAEGVASNGMKEERPGNTDHAHGDIGADGRIVATYAAADGSILVVRER